MKIKFARTLAIASALSVAFAGLTAFAAVPTVETITTYDHDGSVTDVEVTTTIEGLTKDTEVAYYVCAEGENGAVTQNIVYIDQATVGDDGKCEFKFTDTKDKFLTAMAKFGSNETAGATFPTFYFSEGINVLSQATGWITVDNKETDWGVVETSDADYKGSYTFKGQVAGNVREYGVRIISADGDQSIYFPAYGSDATDGTFIIAINGITEAQAKAAVPYIINQAGEYDVDNYTFTTPAEEN